MSFNIKDAEPLILGLLRSLDPVAEARIYDFCFTQARKLSDHIAQSDLLSDDYAEDKLEVAIRGIADGLRPDNVQSSQEAQTAIAEADGNSE